MKKILIFNLNGRGGMLHYSAQFSNALSKVHDIRVIVPSYTDTGLYEKNIPIWRIRTYPNLLSFILDSLNIYQHIGLIYTIWKFRPDILQIIDNHPWYFFYPLIGKLCGAQIYVIQHDPFPHSGENTGLFHKVAIWVNRFLRKYSDMLIVHGEKMRQKVIENYKVPPEKIISIYHGSMSLTLIHKKNEKIKKGKKTFLFFGRIVEYKGLDILLSALQLLEDEGVEFHALIAGDGNISRYRSEFEKLDSKNYTLVNRFIEDSEVSSFFEQSNFVVLPYKDATASGIIPLAYSFSLPIIATTVGVLPDYVKNNETGILIPPNSPEVLRDAIKELLGNSAKTMKLGENAFKFQKEELSWDNIIKKIYHVS